MTTIVVGSICSADQRGSPETARNMLATIATELAGGPVPITHRPGFAPQAAGLALSLSRSVDVAMGAVVPSGAIGIDVERIRPLPDAGDVAALIDRAAPNDPRSLLELWTRKEALAKAMGTGLPDDVRGLQVPRQRVPLGQWLRQDGWLWIGCPCDRGCVASLVVRSRKPDDRGVFEPGPMRSVGIGVSAWSFQVPL